MRASCILGEERDGKRTGRSGHLHHGRRADRPFLCDQLRGHPETLLESELFGHERGAFTGADRKRIGKLSSVPAAPCFWMKLAT